MACLALIASRPGPGPVTGEAAVAAAGLLASRQRPDGSLRVAGEPEAPGWPTPHAILAWSALGGYGDSRRRAVQWLLAQEGNTFTEPAGTPRLYGHDPTLVGWPWVLGTHSWLDPTSMAVWTLRREGYAGHPRVMQGLGLIRDRAIDSGGWNYGNKAVFGNALRPQPGPTGLALVALSGTGGRTSVEDRAIRYLLAALPAVRAPESLGWGLLGLRAWGTAPGGAEGWLEEAYRKVSGRPDAGPRLAFLLLAGGDHSPELFAPGRPR